MRSGGFGGPEGLTAYLRATGIAAVFDATHPFAAQITAHAAQRLCRRRGAALPPAAGGVADPAGRSLACGREPAGGAGLAPAAGTARVRRRWAARAWTELGAGTRVHLRHARRSPGRRTCPTTSSGWRAGRRSRSRPRWRCCAGTRSRALFIQASGGELTYAKLAAARELRLPVVMLTRPQPPAGAAGSVPEALAWLAGVLGRRTCE